MFHKATRNVHWCGVYFGQPLILCFVRSVRGLALGKEYGVYNVQLCVLCGYGPVLKQQLRMKHVIPRSTARWQHWHDTNAFIGARRNEQWKMVWSGAWTLCWQHVASKWITRAFGWLLRELSEWSWLRIVYILDPTYVFSRNHGESAVDGFPVRARVVGVPEQRHALRCGLAAGLPNCNSALCWVVRLG
jgi:5-methylcytosine-specific restriction endonuclease McrA